MVNDEVREGSWRHSLNTRSICFRRKVSRVGSLEMEAIQVWVSGLWWLLRMAVVCGLNADPATILKKNEQPHGTWSDCCRIEIYVSFSLLDPGPWRKHVEWSPSLATWARDELSKWPIRTRRSWFTSMLWLKNRWGFWMLSVVSLFPSESYSRSTADSALSAR